MTTEEKLLLHIWRMLDIPAGVQYVSYRVRQYRDEPRGGCFQWEDGSEFASIWFAHQLQRQPLEEAISKLQKAGLIESFWDGRWSDWDDAIKGSPFEWSRFGLSNEAADFLRAELAD